MNNYKNVKLIDLINELKYDSWKKVLLKRKSIIDDIQLNLDAKAKLTNNNFLPLDPNNIFKAFNKFDRNKLKVVLIGQDPYPNKLNAMGLAFAVPDNKKRRPGSLINIDKVCGKILNWEELAENGVLLLNTALTVEENKPKSHNDIEWNYLILSILKLLSKTHKNIVFIMWGNDAINMMSMIDENPDNLYLRGGHPSPLNTKEGKYGKFSAQNWFKTADEFLKKNKRKRAFYRFIN